MAAVRRRRTLQAGDGARSAVRDVNAEAGANAALHFFIFPLVRFVRGFFRVELS